MCTARGAPLPRLSDTDLSPMELEVGGRRSARRRAECMCESRARVNHTHAPTQNIALVAEVSPAMNGNAATLTRSTIVDVLKEEY